MSLKKHQASVGKNDEWLTPPSILKALGTFDLDPCAPINRPWDTAKNHYTINDDGLSKEWFGRVWMNPPFNRFERKKWMKRMCEHGNGVMLVPAACETYGFKDYVFGRCSGILMLHTRPKFFDVNGIESKFNAGATIALVSYGKRNLISLMNSHLGHTLIEAR